MVTGIGVSCTSGGGERQHVAKGRRERGLDSYNGCPF